VSRVVIARMDTNTPASGGVARLREAGVRVDVEEGAEPARRLTDPFFMRLEQGRPWVIAKWAQTIDGRIATRAGESQWISSRASRRRVHRLRAQVDAIIAGVGTVLTDDPRLNARGVARRRRVARRVVLDSSLRTPPDAALLRERDGGEVIIIGGEDQRGDAGWEARRSALEAAGATLWSVGRVGRGLDLAAALRRLGQEREAMRVMLESGPRMLGAFFDADLVDEAQVYVGSLVLGDAEASGAAAGRVAPRLSDARTLRLVRVARSGGDALLHYWRDGWSLGGGGG
jgi:diaminohydroxyphosphoribosylaminopyrimidine deaminase/5-amino-6-(5-phosphoribosylamino)uracil reductase